MNNQKGAIRPLICILLLVASAYLGYKFVGPYYRYYSLKSETKEIARLNYRNPERYKRLVYDKAVSLNIPIEYADISVSISERSVNIYTSWTETVKLPAGYSVTLKFEVDVEE
jgi:hypothetical protein